MITHLQISLPGFEPCKRTTRCLQTRATGRKSNTNTVDAKEVATRRSLKDTAPLSVPSKSPEVEDAAQASLVIDREARTPANGPSPPAPAPPEEPPSATPSSPAPKKKSSSTTARSGRGRPRLKDGEDPPTELIFKLERRGDGWGEEFIPHITVENRPLEPSGRGRRRRQPAEDDEEEEEGEGVRACSLTTALLSCPLITTQTLLPPYLGPYAHFSPAPFPICRAARLWRSTS